MVLAVGAYQLDPIRFFVVLNISLDLSKLFGWGLGHPANMRR
jgi:hypothetical protein